MALSAKNTDSIGEKRKTKMRKFKIFIDSCGEMPKEMRDVLPTIEQLESELADDGPAQTGKKRGGKPK